MRPSRDDGFHPFGQVPAREQNPVTATLALDADIRSQPDDGPVAAAARMRLPQPEHVAET
jgi:hypothetical protein